MSASRFWRHLTVLTFAVTIASRSILAASTCNGYAEFCDRKYSNVSIIGTHNSYGVGVDNVAANQNYSITTQLDDGIRMLQVQGHLNNGSLHLCHTSCFLLDGGTFTAYLQTVKSWLDDNPNEVITILMVNSDGLPATTWADSYSAAGLSDYVYTPSSVPIAYDDWPTYGELIGNGTRLVNFLAQQADIEAAPFLLDEFTNIWETAYGITTYPFPCAVNRVTGSSSGKMYLMNHFLDRNVSLLGQAITVPAVNELNSTNAATGDGSLGQQATTCYGLYDQYPTFTLVDYYDVGNGSVFAYAAQLNGVRYTPVQIGNGSSTTTTTSNSTRGPVGSSSSSATRSSATSTSGSGSGTTSSTSLSASTTLGISASLLISSLVFIGGSLALII